MRIRNFVWLYLFVFLVGFNFNYAQVKKIVLIDNDEKYIISDVKILTKNDNVLTISNEFGLIYLDLEFLKKNKYFEIKTSHFLYDSNIFNISTLTDTIWLDRKTFFLNEVIVTAPKKEKQFYKISAYFRSWRLSNNKLQNYVEGLKEVVIPYDNSKSTKEYFTAYISFKDSLFNKNFIDISIGGDGYLFTKIYREDYYTRFKNNYELIKKSAYNFDLKEDNSIVGNVKFDIDNQISEIIKRDIADGVKIFGKSLSYKNYVYEKWNNLGKRHLQMSRNTIKKEVKSKSQIISVETVTEIYVFNVDYQQVEKPKKYKNIINPNKSFYSSLFYEEYRKKYPLQPEIEVQLSNLKFNENSY